MSWFDKVGRAVHVFRRRGCSRMRRWRRRDDQRGWHWRNWRRGRGSRHRRRPGHFAAERDLCRPNQSGRHVQPDDGRTIVDRPRPCSRRRAARPLVRAPVARQSISAATRAPAPARWAPSRPPELPSPFWQSHTNCRRSSAQPAQFDDRLQAVCPYGPSIPWRLRKST